MTAHTPGGGGLTEAEREALVARALFDHDWLGSTDKNREAVWVMHRDAYVDKARAVMPVIARIVAAEHDGCADLLDAASERILAARSAPDTEAVAAALEEAADLAVGCEHNGDRMEWCRICDEWVTALRDRAAGVREGRA